MRFVIALVCGLLLVQATARASTVWSAGAGDITITRPAGADGTLAANQDRITANVWITRGGTQGLYNAESETVFTHGVSPADTEWAFSSLDGNTAFAYGAGASDHAALTFAPWETSLGAAGALETNILDRPGVLHLITDDIFIDIQFSAYANGHSGPNGAFTYQRAVAPASVPEPATLATLALGFGMILCVGKMPRRRASRA